MMSWDEQRIDAIIHVISKNRNTLYISIFDSSMTYAYVHLALLGLFYSVVSTPTLRPAIYGLTKMKLNEN